ncbi:hypothetical protein VUR80DRAFT_3623 [Thermomyces stellatus]
MTEGMYRGVSCALRRHRNHPWLHGPSSERPTACQSARRGLAGPARCAIAAAAGAWPTTPNAGSAVSGKRTALTRLGRFLGLHNAWSCCRPMPGRASLATRPSLFALTRCVGHADAAFDSYGASGHHPVLWRKQDLIPTGLCTDVLRDCSTLSSRKSVVGKVCATRSIRNKSLGPRDARDEPVTLGGDLLLRRRRSGTSYQYPNYSRRQRSTPRQRSIAFRQFVAESVVS